MSNFELHFKQGTSDYFLDNHIKEDEKIAAVQAKISELFNMKNVVSFLEVERAVLPYPI